jgi:hypothetical protein
VLKRRNDRGNVGTELASLFERVQQRPVIDRSVTQVASELAVNVLGDELPEQLADRNGSRGLLERRPRLIVDVNPRHVIAPNRRGPIVERGH